MAEFKKLTEVQENIAAKRKALAVVFDEAGAEFDTAKVKSVEGGSDAVVDFIRKSNDELAELGAEESRLNVLVRGAENAKRASENGREYAGQGEREYVKSIGERFTDTAEYKANAKKATVELDVEVKTLFTTSAGWAPEVTRTGRVMELVTTPIDMLDIIPVVSTGQSANKYMQETTRTNNAAEIAEGGTYAESAFALSEVTDPIRKIGHTVALTDEQAEDVSTARSYLENRMIFGIRQRLNTQVVAGAGTGILLKGFLATAGIQNQNKGADPVPDAVLKALSLVRVTGQANPNAAVFSPLDWQAVRLLRTADGIYIWGSPSEAGPESIWGVRVVQIQGLTSTNKVLVGDFANFSEIVSRRGLDVETTNSHSAEFLSGVQRMRADIRVGLSVYRPAAFATVTLNA